MPRNFVKITLLVLLFALSTAPQSAPSTRDIAGTWHGNWTSPEGFLYEAYMTLTVDGSNNVVGSIHWTLRKSPRPDLQAKIGVTGVEHVNGVFLPDAGVVRMEGTSLDDPNHILGMDKYRLIVSDDARVLGGITWDHGPWTGQFLLQRQ